MPQSIHLAHTHIVFSTKHRRPLLTEAVRPVLHAYLAEVLRRLECGNVLVGGVADHVHIYSLLTKKVAPVRLMEELKRDSSKWIKQRFPECGDFFWQDGYGMFSVSPKHVPALIDYIRNQEAHHREESFQDEYRRLLERYGYPLDERYLWD